MCAAMKDVCKRETEEMEELIFEEKKLNMAQRAATEDLAVLLKLIKFSRTDTQFEIH